MSAKAELGMVGLGRMGANMVRRLMRDGHRCVVYDVNPAAVETLVAEGAEGAASPAELAAKLSAPRAVWVMVPAGHITESTVNAVAAELEAGDAIIDGGNSYYRDDIRRAAELAKREIDYIDCGTSGGVFGLERGYCLMIGGPDAAVERLDSVFATLAPGVDSAERTPGRDGDVSPAENGYLHCGPVGAGHFVKMVHNGIEYGVMAAYAEGLNVLRNANAGSVEREADAETAPLEHPEYYQYEIDLPDVAEVWRRGSVIGSWLLDLTATALLAITRARDVLGSRLRLGRGPLDVDRGDRGGRADTGSEHGALHPLLLPRARRLRRQGALGDAQAVRGPRGETGLTAAVEPYFDLGSYTRATSTASTSAQTWFERGLVWSYAFHHEEAIRCFERALEHDPGFALAHWGVAYAIGPNYNKEWEAFDPVDLAASLEKACDEVAAARACADRAAPVERALVEALGSRYQANDPAADLVGWNADYAEAMRDVYRAHPDDLDVAALFADALMNLTPWALWDRYTGLPPDGAATLEAKEVLEQALERPGGRSHPGLVHLYVHLMEMSPFPEQALPVADELRSLVPDAGHLVHMPTHIDVLCGDYQSTLAWNLRAIEVNEKYVAREGLVGFYSLYHAHDRHFAIYGAMFLGRSQVALEVAAGLEASLPEELLRIEQPPMADYLEAFVPMRLHVLIRFGMWEDILALALPGDPELYSTTTAMTHYAQGVAYAATGRLAEAEAARDAFVAAVARVPASRYLFNNTCQDILAVAGAMLDGELEYRRGKLRRGVRAPAPGDRARRRAAVRRALGLDAANAPCLRRAAARAGSGRGGRDRLRRGPRL